ncbi:hypothetical protein BOTCAL_0540g00020 [Botryotinia calthae]|uniref:HAT C-terminal dimerisation domain-containing protein n=1 Tax=Botryotinia calthae TaxID=38488 RepID=A0A4Y8CKA5_9HELO|nr:hypothetical protein BOTCAL_0540g00020 [Botryotinia calthae]
MVHYRNKHAGIATSEAEERVQTKSKIHTEGRLTPFPPASKPLMPMMNQHNRQYRRRLLQLIVKNNLPFSVIDQTEFDDLIKFVAPNAKNISRRQLMEDLKEDFEGAKEVKRKELQKQMEAGGRFSLTTEGWSGHNRLDYITVTVHYKLDSGIIQQSILDVVELRNPSHTGKYLAQKLFEVTNDFGITKAIISITRDNTSCNTVMLDHFERMVWANYMSLSNEEKAYHSVMFNRINGDVRCSAQINNAAVQAGLHALKSEPSENRHIYEFQPNQALNPYANGIRARSALFKLRSLCSVFRNKRKFRSALKQQCIIYRINYRRLLIDVPVRWNSTNDLVSEALRQQAPITAVLATQSWDKSIKENLFLTDNDWSVLIELKKFFACFQLPTTKAQADCYPTLQNMIPKYILLVRKMSKMAKNNNHPTLQTASKAALRTLEEYYETNINTRHAWVALVLDPRYKFDFIKYLYKAEDVIESEAYQKATQHVKTAFAKYKDRSDKIRIFLEEKAREARIDGDTNDDDYSLRDVPAAMDNDSSIDLFAEFDRLMPPTTAPTPAPKSELDGYLKMARIPWFENSLEDVTKWWIEYQHSFPILFQMWKDYSAIPASAASSERVSSAAGLLVTEHRTKLPSDTIRYVLCLRAWGVLPEEEAEEDIEFIDIDPSDDDNDSDIEIERAVSIPGPTLQERRIEEARTKE